MSLNIVCVCLNVFEWRFECAFICINITNLLYPRCPSVQSAGCLPIRFPGLSPMEPPTAPVLPASNPPRALRCPGWLDGQSGASPASVGLTISAASPRLGACLLFYGTGLRRQGTSQWWMRGGGRPCSRGRLPSSIHTNVFVYPSRPHPPSFTTSAILNSFHLLLMPISYPQRIPISCLEI